MGVRQPKRNPGFLPTSGIRECRHYSIFLNRNNIATPDYTYFSASEICSSINTILTQHYSDLNLRDSFIDEMVKFKDSEIIPREEFKWIKNNERACYWTWATLKLATHQYLNLFPIKTPNSPLTFIPNPYDELNLKQNPVDTKERLEIVFDFFDRLDQPKSIKIKILENLKAGWTNVFNNIKPFKWLDKENHDQLEWTWNYFLKEHLPVWFIKPSNHHERYLAIIAVFDIWETHKDTKKLFSININKAWSQKKFRDQTKDRKPLNTYLEKDTKHKLEQLSKNYNLNITRTLEKIINEEYERYQKSTL